MADRLVLSVPEAADTLGISDDLVYELIERRELPCLRFGRRKVIPRVAIDLVIQRAMHDFDPNVVVASLSVGGDQAPEHDRRDAGGADRLGTAGCLTEHEEVPTVSPWVTERRQQAVPGFAGDE